ncbi:hypothetical protein G7046_g3484 [Stylonectria norvegica]|nr:hypothetical protein G7046_g3484 [Stylonectria norvegica]
MPRCDSTQQKMDSGRERGRSPTQRRDALQQAGLVGPGVGRPPPHWRLTEDPGHEARRWLEQLGFPEARAMAPRAELQTAVPVTLDGCLDDGIGTDRLSSHLLPAAAPLRTQREAIVALTNTEAGSNGTALLAAVAALLPAIFASPHLTSSSAPSTKPPMTMRSPVSVSADSVCRGMCTAQCAHMTSTTDISYPYRTANCVTEGGQWRRLTTNRRARVMQQMQAGIWSLRRLDHIGAWLAHAAIFSRATLGCVCGAAVLGDGVVRRDFLQVMDGRDGWWIGDAQDLGLITPHSDSTGPTPGAEQSHGSRELAAPSRTVLAIPCSCRLYALTTPVSNSALSTQLHCTAHRPLPQRLKPRQIAAQMSRVGHRLLIDLGQVRSHPSPRVDTQR